MGVVIRFFNGPRACPLCLSTPKPGMEVEAPKQRRSLKGRPTPSAQPRWWENTASSSFLRLR